MKSLKILSIIALLFISSTAIAQQKFGIVSTQQLLYSMPEIDSVNVKLKEAEAAIIADMQATEKEYTQKMQDFQKNAESYSQTMREQKENDLRELMLRMQEFQQVAQRSLAEKQQELMMPVQRRLVDAIQKVSKENDFVFVFDAGSAAYASQTLVVDITPMVMTELGLEKLITRQTTAQ